jgi:phage baseplate assembly protein W
MTPDRYSTFQFLHPDLDIEQAQERDIAYAANPSQVTTTKRGGFQVEVVNDRGRLRGRLAMVKEQASVRQATLLLLSTQPKERVMRPDYGCDLEQCVFQPNNHETAQRAKNEVQHALLQWEPRITSEVQTGTDPQHPERLEIVVDYQVKGEQDNHAINVAVDIVR